MAKAKVPEGVAGETYADFVVASRERLLRALVAHHGPDVGAESLADAFAYAWEHWSKVSTCRNPIGYVFRVGDRIGVRRSMRARRECVVDSEFDRVGSSATNREEWGDISEGNLGLKSVLERLPPRQRAAVLLVHGYGWSYRDAAETLDIPTTTLTNEVARGTQKLREHMIMTSEGRPQYE
jgi:RNA polymerase sigma factor (sigma-70 family)